MYICRCHKIKVAHMFMAQICKTIRNKKGMLCTIPSIECSLFHSPTTSPSTFFYSIILFLFLLYLFLLNNNGSTILH